MSKRWPASRRRELAKLQRLLREAGSINHGSDCVARIRLVEELARALGESNLNTARKSFMLFLIEQAAGEEASHAE